MSLAIALTVVVAGGILVYSGFKDVNLWETFLGVIRPVK